MSGLNAFFWVLTVLVAGASILAALSFVVNLIDEWQTARLQAKLSFLQKHTKCEGGVWVTRFERQLWHVLWEKDIDYVMANERREEEAK